MTLKAELDALRRRVVDLEQSQQLILHEVDKRIRSLREHVKKFFPE